MTTAEEILKAVSFLVKEKGMKTFRRADIKKQIGADEKRWENNYDPTFQGMREDEPGRAHNVGEKYRRIFRRVSYGVHTLTEYGKEMIKKY
jgi:hypothetical protein